MSRFYQAFLVVLKSVQVDLIEIKVRKRNDAYFRPHLRMLSPSVEVNQLEGI